MSEAVEKGSNLKKVLTCSSDQTTNPESTNLDFFPTLNNLSTQKSKRIFVPNMKYGYLFLTKRNGKQNKTTKHILKKKNRTRTLLL